MEIWKDVIGYEGLYQVSNLGNVKSLLFCKEKILKPYLAFDKYLVVNLYKDKKSKVIKIHQLVASSFLGHLPCGYKMVVNHINFVRTDNRTDNLEIVTSRENCNKKHLESTSKYTGVSWSNRDKKWKSSIYFKDKHIYLGCFSSEIEASKYYKNALKSIKKNKEIISKKNSFSSIYKGVYWHKKSKKWMSRIVINNKRVYLGLFDSEIKASNAYQLKFSQFKNTK